MSVAATVDLDAIAGSVATCRRAAPASEVMAVVKADGYGHGLLPSARAALAGGATWLGCAQVSEALLLRAGGITAPVLSWLNPPDEPMAAAVAAGIDIAVSAPWAVTEVADAAAETGRTARLHLKADTGLARNGATAADWPALVDAAARAAASGRVEVIGVMTHLVHADAPDHPEIDAQLERFAAAVEVMKGRGLRPALRHVANSAATLTRPDTHFELVRPGLACYGLSPVPAVASAADLGLVPAMTFGADVALVKRVPAGQGVSYGHHWHAPRETTLALLPVGYADGVPRAATNRAQVWLAGARRPLVGLVCMDQLLVNICDDVVREGDPALFFGSGASGEPTAEDWAGWLDTISYEVVTRIGPRVPRVYVGRAGVAGAAA